MAPWEPIPKETDLHQGIIVKFQNMEKKMVLKSSKGKTNAFHTKYQESERTGLHDYNTES